MKGHYSHLEQLARANEDFRRVLYTGEHSQLVLMCVMPGHDIGLETHVDTDQFFRFEGGKGMVLIDGNEYEVSDGDAVIIPAGAEHNVINVSETENLTMYTIYSPAHHKDGIIRSSKEEAMAHEEEFDGVTTE